MAEIRDSMKSRRKEENTTRDAGRETTRTHPPTDGQTADEIVTVFGNSNNNSETTTARSREKQKNYDSTKVVLAVGSALSLFVFHQATSAERPHGSAARSQRDSLPVQQI
jgi:hypothetical protein